MHPLDRWAPPGSARPQQLLHAHQRGWNWPGARPRRWAGRCLPVRPAAQSSRARSGAMAPALAGARPAQWLVAADPRVRQVLTFRGVQRVRQARRVQRVQRVPRVRQVQRVQRFRRVQRVQRVPQARQTRTCRRAQWARRVQRVRRVRRVRQVQRRARRVRQVRQARAGPPAGPERRSQRQEQAPLGLQALLPRRVAPCCRQAQALAPTVLRAWRAAVQALQRVQGQVQVQVQVQVRLRLRVQSPTQRAVRCRWHCRPVGAPALRHAGGRCQAGLWPPTPQPGPPAVLRAPRHRRHRQPTRRLDRCAQCRQSRRPGRLAHRRLKRQPARAWRPAWGLPRHPPHRPRPPTAKAPARRSATGRMAALHRCHRQFRECRPGRSPPHRPGAANRLRAMGEGCHREGAGGPCR